MSGTCGESVLSRFETPLADRMRQGGDFQLTLLALLELMEGGSLERLAEDLRATPEEVRAELLGIIARKSADARFLSGLAEA